MPIKSLGLLPNAVNNASLRKESEIPNAGRVERWRHPVYAMSSASDQLPSWQHWVGIQQLDNNTLTTQVYMPYYYYCTQNDTWYCLKQWGSHNAIYFPLRSPSNRGYEWLPEENIDYIFRAPLPDAEKEDEPRRIVRLHHNHHQAAILDPSGCGAYVRYYAAAGSPTQAEILAGIYEEFRIKGRVVLDGFVPGNFIVTQDADRQRRVHLIDYGDCYSFESPDSPENSQISLEKLSEKIQTYLNFLPDYFESGNAMYKSASRLTAALMVLASCELRLEDPENFLTHDTLINYLITIFMSQEIVGEISDKFKNFFTEDSLKAFKKRQLCLASLKSEFNLSAKEIQVLRLDPSLYHYKSIFQRMCQIIPDVSQELRLYCLHEFNLLSAEFDKVLTVFSAGAGQLSEGLALKILRNHNQLSEECARNWFSYFFLKRKDETLRELTPNLLEKYFAAHPDLLEKYFAAHPGYSDSCFVALNDLQSEQNLMPQRARAALRGVAVEDVKFLAGAFRYGVRQEMLEKHELRGNPEKQDLVLGCLRASEGDTDYLDPESRNAKLHHILSLELCALREMLEQKNQVASESDVRSAGSVSRNLGRSSSSLCSQGLFSSSGGILAKGEDAYEEGELSEEGDKPFALAGFGRAH